MINDNLVIINLESNTDIDVLNALAELLIENGYVKDSFKQAVKDREKSFPTGLVIDEDFGIAVPHADREHVKKIGIAMATLKEPVLFGRMGGDDNETIPVSLVCMLAIDNPDKHIEILSNLMELFSNHDVLKDIRNCKTKENFFELLLKYNI